MPSYLEVTGEDSTGLSFWKPMLINVIELAFPMGEVIQGLVHRGIAVYKEECEASSRGNQGREQGKRKKDGSSRKIR